LIRSGSSVVVTLASGNLPAASSVDITGIPPTYTYLLLQINSASSDTATRHLQVQHSLDGSTFATSGYVGTTAESANFAKTTGDVAAATLVNVNMAIFAYQGGMIPFAMCTSSDNAGAQVSEVRSQANVIASPIVALRIKLSDTGNFDSGSYLLHGVR
jgi:hypothetical protein